VERELLFTMAPATEVAGGNGGRNMSAIRVMRKNTPEVPGTFVRRELEPFRLMRDLFRWDPFHEMRPVWSGEGASYAPAFDVKETKEAFVFKADLPGMKEKDLEVTSTGNHLTISGKREVEKEEKDETFYAYERTFGAFTRAFTLPDYADATHVRAELNNGELTIVVPKMAAAVAKRIPISTGDIPKT
jgi:HSP20 family protein